MRKNVTASAVRILALLYVLCVRVESRSCSKIPPGLSRMRNGVDITQLDFFHQDISSNPGYRYPLFEYTCNGNKTRVIDGETFDIPDQIWNIHASPSGIYDAKVRIYKSSSDVRKDLAANANVGLSSGIFSASGSYRKMQNTLTNESKYIEQVSAFVSAKIVALIPYWGIDLDRFASMHIEHELPLTLTGNVHNYRTFIERFGTHYMKRAKFGGMLQMTLQTETSYFEKNSDKKVSAQARGTFFKFFNFGGGGSHSTTSVDTKFTQVTTNSVSYFGGETNLLANGNGISKWQPTVDSNPWLFSAELEPVHNLIKNASKKANMERAVEIYLDMAYLKELERLLHSMKYKLPVALRGTLQRYRTQVTSLAAKESPSHSEVISLGKAIEEALVVPAWFSKGVNLCYRWYPDGDGGQCGGGAGRHLCAAPGQMTPYYRDDTDGRDGGCRMSWGIKSIHNEIPNWFKNVEVCYQWYPDGDGGQCGGGANRLLCAKVEKFTPYYRDDTDGRGGGCQMQWKLSVPSESPPWLHQVKLCYEWYPDGNGGQCGGGVSRNLCAQANSWTSYYRDDTDGRGGGCQMRWGLRV